MDKKPYMLAAGALVLGVALGVLATVWTAKPGMTPSPSYSGEREAPSSHAEGEAPTPAAQSTQTISVPAGPDPPGDELERPIVVSVCGAVKRGGIYRFERDSRVQDAIRSAGGLLDDADIEDINIAARLLDDTTLYIPFQIYTQQDGRSLVAKRTATAVEMNPGRYTRSGWAGLARSDTPLPAATFSAAAQETPAEGMSNSPATLGSNRPINLNTASSSELQELPGIGPKTAKKIIAYRQQRHFKHIDELMEVHGIGEKKLEAVRNLVTVE